jgi:hypothetical protein
MTASFKAILLSVNKYMVVPRAARCHVELRLLSLARRCYLVVRSGTDIIKIAWVPILDRCLYAGVSPNPSDYLEPLC